MPKGQNYKQQILQAIDNMSGWGNEVHLDALVQDTGLPAARISTCINQMRHKGFPISVARTEGRKHVAWKFEDQAKWTEKVVATSKEKGEAFKAGEDIVSDVAKVLKVLEAAGKGQEVPIADIVAATGLKLTAIKKVVSQNRLEKDGRIEVIKPGVYKLALAAWRVKSARVVRNEMREEAGDRVSALKPVHKGTNFIAQSLAHNTMREAANSPSRTEAFKQGYTDEEVDALRGTDASAVMRATKGYTNEDLEYGRRVLQNFDRLPHEVKDKIEVLKQVAPEFTEDLENVLVKVLGLSTVQDADPSFWAVDQFADGSLMLARKDGTHWKATKL